MITLHTWAARHAITLEAFRELQLILGTYSPPLPDTAPEANKSEAWAQNEIRIEASQAGIVLFRNNVGVLEDKNGRPVRYGLANDSKQVNETIKSGDLIGIRPLTITAAHVGYTIGQFVSRECKRPGWQYTGQGREPAQLAWAKLIISRGGDAGFATGRGTL